MTPLFAFDNRSVLIFLGLSVILSGAASYSAGRALALRWRPIWHGAVAALLIAAAARFLHYALFGEPLVSLARYGLDFAAAFGFVLSGFKLTRRSQMKQQYGPIFAREDAPRGSPASTGKPS
ncbi:DUF6867 family protein [Methylocella tundrae]|uniref:DUF6867 domain-containing protein n=1 Tax=Methylocella tundrae TaxID=227605 RepID=A0A4U8Z0U9_METTU|nr:hypothetical protein [Methylocella tundrae]WPP06230.1 hypothetical protein SIN04_10705 [Methylocella tundrae]VFU08898.1 conserved membrane protein of unknown function [Methylocella tundrae]